MGVNTIVNNLRVSAARTVKQPAITAFYNKKNITSDISKYLISLTYTDYERNQADELEIRLKDDKQLFQKNWRPEKGDKLTAWLGYSDDKLLNCGTFTIDETELTMSDAGDEFIIKALAASINEKIRQADSKSYKNKTLIEIAREIAAKHDYTVAGSHGFIKIPYIAQIHESDLSFLSRLAELYGYIFKLTDNVITFIPQEILDNKNPILTLKRKDLKSLSLKDTGVKTYNSCSVNYLDSKGKLITYTAKSTNSEGLKNETLKLDVKCSCKTEAIRVADAGLKRASKTIEGALSLPKGCTRLVAGVNINLELNNSYDGKYHVVKTVHTVTTDDYLTEAEVEK